MILEAAAKLETVSVLVNVVLLREKLVTVDVTVVKEVKKARPRAFGSFPTSCPSSIEEAISGRATFLLTLTSSKIALLATILSIQRATDKHDHDTG